MKEYVIPIKLSDEEKAFLDSLSLSERELHEALIAGVLIKEYIYLLYLQDYERHGSFSELMDALRHHFGWRDFEDRLEKTALIIERLREQNFFEEPPERNLTLNLSIKEDYGHWLHPDLLYYHHYTFEHLLSGLLFKHPELNVDKLNNNVKKLAKIIRIAPQVEIDPIKLSYGSVRPEEIFSENSP